MEKIFSMYYNMGRRRVPSSFICRDAQIDFSKGAMSNVAAAQVGKSKVTKVCPLHCSVFFCFQVRISDLELHENLLWETIAIVDICGVRKK
jgi:hypothetical protein